MDSVPFGAVAVQSGAVRAVALVHGEEQPNLTWLTIASDARERGLATGMLAFITAALHQRGVGELASAVSAANIASLRWHLTRGFVLAADPLREVQRSTAARGDQAPSALAPTSETPPCATQADTATIAPAP